MGISILDHSDPGELSDDHSCITPKEGSADVLKSWAQNAYHETRNKGIGVQVTALWTGLLCHNKLQIVGSISPSLKKKIKMYVKCIYMPMARKE